MSDNQNVINKLNKISAGLPLVSKDDLSALMEIISDLEAIKNENDIPKAMISQADRTAKLAEHVVMQETPFENGLDKLGQSIRKMIEALEGRGQLQDDEISGNNPDNENTEEKEGPENSDNLDLTVKFASAQKNVLEDFEAYILEFEKGNSQARAEIKRLLHTLKGEFGVLDLQDYSALIHDVEEALTGTDFDAENFFRLKDLLSKKFESMTSGDIPELTGEERDYVFESAAGSDEAEKPAENDETANSKEEDKSDAFHTMSSEEIEKIIANDSSLVADFIAESKDHIGNAENGLLELESDPSNAEHINGIFRACHTIKGVAGFIGFKDVQELSHSMENMMDQARNGKLNLESSHIDILLESMDCLKAVIESVESALEGGKYNIPDNFNSVMKSVSPPFTDKSDEADVKKVGEILVEKGSASEKDVQDALDIQKKGDPRRVGEIMTESGTASEKDIASAVSSQNASRQKRSVEDTIRVPVNRLDKLIDSIGEAVIAQSMVSADPDIVNMKNQNLEKKIANADTIMRQVQELSMSLRMVSLKSTFQKMARLVRDLSKKSGKNVEFVMEGEDTEIDKSMVEKISDPLIHMIRNAVDHGIEPSEEERKKAGKGGKATVTLRAYHKGGNICIEVEDDGKGLDREVILEKAVNKGLCKDGEGLTDQEIFHYIFEPGFSTAKQITDVSGRGVGMDVVKRNIQSLRGSTDISSEKGKGTVFSMRLPLTLAIIDGMIIKTENEKYIIPTLSIIESLKPQEGQIEKVLGRREMIDYRGDMLPVVNLTHIFNKSKISNNGKALTEGIVMVVEDMLGKKTGLFMDEIIGQQQVVIKSLGEGMGEISGVSGGAIMSDGTVSLILDIGEIVKMAES